MALLRPATPDDFTGIEKLATQLARHTNDPLPQLSPEQLAQFFFSDPPIMHCVVAEEQGQVVGMISWMLHFDLYSSSRRVFIADLSIDQAHRGKEIGTALFAHVTAWAKQQSAVKITFEVWRYNDTAQAFYAKHGAGPDPEIVNYRLPLSS